MAMLHRRNRHLDLNFWQCQDCLKSALFISFQKPVEKGRLAAGRLDLELGFQKRRHQ